jgi:hypothetical protein
MRGDDREYNLIDDVAMAEHLMILGSEYLGLR